MRAIDRGKQSNCRRWGFEQLESREMLSVSVELASRAIVELETPSGSSYVRAISANGRYVLFNSNAPNLVPGLLVSPDFYNLYRHDRTTGETILVSADASGQGGANGNCLDAQISADGDVVAFRSGASNLSLLDQDTKIDVFARRISTGQTELVSINRYGTGGAGFDCTDFDFSANGNSIVFSTKSSSMHPLDVNNYSDVFVRQLDSQTTTLVSIDHAGNSSGTGDSNGPQISDDGSLVGFVSLARLVGEVNQNSQSDIYVRDLSANSTRLVSVSFDGTATGNGDSSAFSMSADGSRIAFVSQATNLNALDSDADEDVFIRYLESGTTELVSVSTDGFGSANDRCRQPLISGDGNVVLFASEASNLHPLDSLRGEDIFARNLGSGETSLVSVDYNNSRGANFFFGSSFSVSSDGRFVAFSYQGTGTHSLEIDLYDGEDTYDVFVRDLWDGQTRLASTNLLGTANGNHASLGPTISRDGTIVAFTSAASDLVSRDGNNRDDVFAWATDAAEISLVSTSSNELAGSTANGRSSVTTSSVSADGRYIVFTSRGTNLVESLEYTSVNVPSNVFRFDRLTGRSELVSVNRFGDGGGNGDSSSASISADGRIVVFRSRSDNLTNQMGSGVHNIFVRDMETGVTTLVSKYRGTYSSGTNGNSKISKDGKVVVFESNTTGTHPLKSGTRIDVFAYNLETDAFYYVSIAANGQSGGNDDSYIGDVSADGSVIAFSSDASNLHPLDTVGQTDVFARNIVTGETHLVSVNSAGTGAGNYSSGGAAISDDGTRIAFSSQATDLHPLDLISERDIFVRDLAQGTTQLVSVNETGTAGTNREQNGNATISSDGKVVVWGAVDIYARELESNTTENVSVNMLGERGNGYDSRAIISDDGNIVAFYSTSNNLSSLDVDRDEDSYDVYVRNRSAGVTELVSVNSSQTRAANAVSYYPALSGDGRVVAFYSEATDLVERDWNDELDVFVAELSWDGPLLPGDYNHDDVVDAADYSVWRDSLGANGLAPFGGADVDGDGAVDQDDYLVWKANFGRVMTAGSGGQGARTRPDSRVPQQRDESLAVEQSVEQIDGGEDVAGRFRLGENVAKSSTEMLSLRRGLELLGDSENRGCAQARSTVGLRAIWRADVSGRQRDLALLAWRSGLAARWRGIRGFAADDLVVESGSSDVGDSDGVFEELGLSGLSLSAR